MGEMAEYYDNQGDEYSNRWSNCNYGFKSLKTKMKTAAKDNKYYIICDSRYNKGQIMYYQENYGFSIFKDNKTLFKKENAERIFNKLRFNNPRIVKE
jgi:hypothetical protein